MAVALAHSTEYGGGSGGGPCDPRDVAFYILEQQIAEFRTVMRALLDSEGEAATKAIADAEELLQGLDQIDREDEADAECEAFQEATHCDCGTFKGAGTSYCPECDAEALERLKSAPDWSNVRSIGPAPF